LDKLLLSETSIPLASWCLETELTAKNVILDSQAIEHLEILPPFKKNKLIPDASLFTKLSCGVRTPFGKRMMKRWVVSPLQDPA
jgi:DNA mismatch repair ATPase MutS